MHNFAIDGPIFLIFCMQVAHVSGQKLYLVAFVKRGQTKAAKAFNIKRTAFLEILAD